MSVTRDIVHSYRNPAQVMRRHLAGGPREDRALMFLMLACALLFVAQWPRLARKAAIDDTITFDVLLAGALFGWIFVAPLFFYGLAALSRLVARTAGGQGTYGTARMALFWTLLTISPLALLRGLVSGFVGPGPLDMIAGLIVLGFFAYLWFANLRAAERPADIETAAQGA
jgi:hypothetical protein